MVSEVAVLAVDREIMFVQFTSSFSVLHRGQFEVCGSTPGSVLTVLAAR